MRRHARPVLCETRLPRQVPVQLHSPHRALCISRKQEEAVQLRRLGRCCPELPRAKWWRWSSPNTLHTAHFLFSSQEIGLAARSKPRARKGVGLLGFDAFPRSLTVDLAGNRRPRARAHS
eukprot:2527263-Pleurochrysis_carterae.AAC.1